MMSTKASSQPWADMVADISEHISRSRACSGLGSRKDESGALVCAECGEPLQQLVDGPGGPVMVPVMCRCLIRKHEEEERKTAADRVRAASRGCFQYKHYRGFTFEAADGKYATEQMEIARRYCEKLPAVDYGLLLYGPPDSGKTYMACCIANRVLEEGTCTVMMRSVPYILSLGYDQTKQQVESMKNVRLLILDDLGAERGSDFAQELVYDVIDHRDVMHMPTVVSTNRGLEYFTDPPDMTQRRICRRVLHMCMPVRMDTGRSRIDPKKYSAIKKELDG